MAKQEAGSGLKQDEFSKIFDEYRARIEEITRRSQNNIQSIDESANAEAAGNIERVESLLKPVQTAAPSPNTDPKPDSPVEETIEVIKAVNPTLSPADPTAQTTSESARAEEIAPDPESYAEIIQNARREAKKIIEEAEESARKDAKKRTQNQVDKISEKARREAEEIIEKATHSAGKIRQDIMAGAKREADFLICDITQKCRQDAEAQSAQIMAESRDKARKMLADVSVSTTMVGQRIAEIVARAKKTAGELESSLQAEAIELSKIVMETQSKLEEASRNTRPESAANAPSPAKTAPSETANNNNPMLAVRLSGKKAPGNNGGGFLFSGQMEMKSISAEFDYRYLKNLKKYLGHVGNIKYLQEYASEKEISVTFDILEPMPLLEVLNNIPGADKVITRADNDICLVFKGE